MLALAIRPTEIEMHAIYPAVVNHKEVLARYRARWRVGPRFGSGALLLTTRRMRFVEGSTPRTYGITSSAPLGRPSLMLARLRPWARGGGLFRRAAGRSQQAPGAEESFRVPRILEPMDAANLAAASRVQATRVFKAF